MSSTDFAAAQARIAARRAEHARPSPGASPPSATSPDLSPSFLALPPSLRTLAYSSRQLWDTISAPYGTRPAFRVGQVDAELLDEELLQLLKAQIGDALKYFGGHLSDEWAPEIVGGLRLVLWKLSIWDRGVSYGGSLQGLRYVDARQVGTEKIRMDGAPGDPTRLQRLAYGLFTVGGRYGWQKWEDWLLEREGGYEEPSPMVQRLSKVTSWLSSTHEVAAFASFLVFLYNGRYRSLVDRLLRLRLAPASAQTSREVSFEYLNRQLVWHAFTEFLLFLLPLVGISRWKRWLARAWKKAKSIVQSKSDDEDESVGAGELGFLPERTCAICYKDQNPTSGASEAEVLAASGTAGGVIGSAQTDVTNAYETIPCGCVYCFVCLAQRIEAEEGEGWTCLRCGEVVKECKPWSGDVIEDSPSRSPSDSKSASRKSVVFADEEFDDEEMVAVEPMPVEDGPAEEVGGLVDGVPDDEGADEQDDIGDREDEGESLEDPLDSGGVEEVDSVYGAEE